MIEPSAIHRALLAWLREMAQTGTAGPPHLPDDEWPALVQDLRRHGLLPLFASRHLS